MNAGSPLTPEERALAQALANLGSPAQPAPSLDARILATARTAAAAPQPKRIQTIDKRSPRRWPIAFGIAASLALAVGVAWRLRPLPQDHAQYSEAPATVDAVMRDSASDMAATPAMRQAAPAANATPASQAAVTTDAPAALPPPAAITPSTSDSAPVDQREHSAPQAPPTAAAQAFPQEKSPTQLQSPPAQREPAHTVLEMPDEPIGLPAPPPPPAPATTEKESPGNAAQNTALGAVTVTGTTAKPAADLAMPPAQSPAEVQSRRAAADPTELSGFSPEEINQQPPANADAPLVQKAWLQRIRELMQNGHVDAAHESLMEFKRRYPQYPLPDDLRVLQTP